MNQLCLFWRVSRNSYVTFLKIYDFRLISDIDYIDYIANAIGEME